MSKDKCDKCGLFFKAKKLNDDICECNARRRASESDFSVPYSGFDVLSVLSSIMDSGGSDDSSSSSDDYSGGGGDFSGGGSSDSW